MTSLIRLPQLRRITMKIIRDIAAVQGLVKDNIRLSIEKELETLLEDFPQTYDPSIHGWFIVLESINDLYAPLAMLPYSLYEKLKHQDFDWLGHHPDFYQILFTLNCNECLLVYLPKQLIHALPELNRTLEQLACPVA